MTVTTPSDREVQLTRVFDAPRRLVFEAYTTPALLKRWLGVREGWTLDVCEIDLRVGGAYRYLWRGPGEVSMGMRGEFREIVAPERLVATEVFDQSWYPGEAWSSVDLVERSGRTTLTMTVHYASREARDLVLRTPMAEGVGGGFDLLEVVLEGLGAPA